MKKRIDELMRLDPDIDAMILGCTHYPLLMPKILKYAQPGVRVVAQGDYVAESLKDYLKRHKEIDGKCSRGGQCTYYTTENPEKFKECARIFLREDVLVSQLDLTNIQ